MQRRLREKSIVRIVSLFVIIGAGLVSMAGYAAAPANAPAETTGLCKDGSYWSGTTKKGACKGHKGVKEWYGAPAAAAAAPAAAATTPQAPRAATAPTTSQAPRAATAPGGGAGRVWVNAESKVYHCPGDRWYGKTKKGEYMSEADAATKGFKPDHGKACR